MTADRREVLNYGSYCHVVKNKETGMNNSENIESGTITLCPSAVALIQVPLIYNARSQCLKTRE